MLAEYDQHGNGVGRPTEPGGVPDDDIIVTGCRGTLIAPGSCLAAIDFNLADLPGRNSLLWNQWIRDIGREAQCSLPTGPVFMQGIRYSLYNRFGGGVEGGRYWDASGARGTYRTLLFGPGIGGGVTRTGGIGGNAGGFAISGSHSDWGIGTSVSINTSGQISMKTTQGWGSLAGANVSIQYTTLRPTC